MRRTYLIVAEKEETRVSLARLLRSGGLTVSLAASVTDVLQTLRSTPVDTIVIASREGESGGDRLRPRILAEQPGCRVITLSRTSAIRGESRSRRFGIGDHLLGEQELLALLLAPHGWSEAHGEGALEEKPLRSLVELVDVLVGLLELGDRHFASSSHRAMRLARVVAEEMHLSGDLALEIDLATLVRDIGKYGIEKNIFAETGGFSQDQTARVREHVVAGTRLLEHIDFPWKILAIVRHHHERYDGLGYPDGLKGPEIPLGARILAVVDAFVAMLSDRPHRPCRSREEAMDELERQAGFQFDPEIVEVFLRAIQERGAPLSALERPRIMIADRDAEFVGLLKMRLHNEGMQVDVATNFQDALLAALDSPPNLILAQVDADETRSFEFLGAIRECDSLAKVPFAFLVPQFDLNLSVRVLSQGVDECLSKSEDIELLAARIRNILVRETRRQSKDAGERRRGISGQLENLPLPDIIQILNMGLKTACVSLASGERSGRIWFDSGAAVHAEHGGQRGTDALFTMLRWKTGEFAIEHGIAAEELTIEGDTIYLLMEGMRLIDEESSEALAVSSPGEAGNGPG